MASISIVFEEMVTCDLYFPLVRRKEITQRAIDVIEYDLDFTERGELSVEEDLQVRSRGPKMTSKRMFESVLARVGEVSLQFGQGQTAGGGSTEPQGMRRWGRCVFDRGDEGKRAI